ncbi:hypothetical protein JCM10212_005899 [Sporobolomyces blumeae]
MAQTVFSPEAGQLTSAERAAVVPVALLVLSDSPSTLTCHLDLVRPGAGSSLRNDSVDDATCDPASSSSYDRVTSDKQQAFVASSIEFRDSRTLDHALSNVTRLVFDPSSFGTVPRGEAGRAARDNREPRDRHPGRDDKVQLRKGDVEWIRNFRSRVGVAAQPRTGRQTADEPSREVRNDLENHATTLPRRLSRTTYFPEAFHDALETVVDPAKLARSFLQSSTAEILALRDMVLGQYGSASSTTTDEERALRRQARSLREAITKPGAGALGATGIDDRSRQNLIDDVFSTLYRARATRDAFRVSLSEAAVDREEATAVNSAAEQSATLAFCDRSPGQEDARQSHALTVAHCGPGGRTQAEPVVADEKARTDFDASLVSKCSTLSPRQTRSTEGRSARRCASSASNSHSLRTLATSLDRFIESRGRPVEAGSTSAQIWSTAMPSRATPHLSEPSLSRSLPFETPPFLTDQPEHDSRPFDPPLRVVVFDELLQRRKLCSALQSSGFELVHRPSRFASSKTIVQDPHLILDSTTCVLYFRLTDLLRSENAESHPTRPEPVSTTCERFSKEYDHVLVVLEEPPQAEGASLRPESFTRPIVEGMRRLDETLRGIAVGRDDAEGGNGEPGARFSVVSSKGPEESAELTRRSAASRDEATLVQMSNELNEFAVAENLARGATTAREFVLLRFEERRDRFAYVSGTTGIDRISLDISNAIGPSLAPTAPESPDTPRTTPVAVQRSSIEARGRDRAEARETTGETVPSDDDPSFARAGSGPREGDEGGTFDDWFDFERYETRVG